MKPKIIPADKMHLIDAFKSAQDAEKKLTDHFTTLKDGGATISEDLLEKGVAATRRTLEALIAIQNLP
jgi:hypothetical protein